VTGPPLLLKAHVSCLASSKLLAYREDTNFQSFSGLYVDECLPCPDVREAAGRFDVEWDGVISGTPQEDGGSSAVFAITNGNDTLHRSIGFFINTPAGTTVSINSYYQLPDAQQNQFYNYNFFGGGAAQLQWSVLNDATHVSTVPPGMSVSNAGALSGTPTSAGVYTFFVQATDASNANNFSIRQFTINVH